MAPRLPRHASHYISDDEAREHKLTQKITFRTTDPPAAPTCLPIRPLPSLHSLQWLTMATESEIPAVIRSFTRGDQAACKALYEQGLIGGKISENDTGLDIDNIEAAYMKDGNHFWVAEADGMIVGMIGVQH